MAITNFVEHDARGFDVPEGMMIETIDKLSLLKFQFVSATWTDGAGENHVIDERDYSVEVLPDRSGLMCVERHFKLSKLNNSNQSGAFVLNENGSLRYRLEVPVELTNLEIPPDTVRYFLSPEESKERNQYGMIAWISGSGSGGYAEGGWYFELDYNTGKFIRGNEVRF